MKKKLSFIMAVCTVIFGIAGCAADSSGTAETQPAASAVAETATSTESETESITTTTMPAAESTAPETDKAEPVVNENRANTEDYTLKEVVVLSRHNIRAPLSSNGALNELATPYEWFKWTSNSSELSLRGGVLETEMGQYFRKWLESEELVPENWMPSDKELRVYANSKQRTLATAQYFSSGFLPTANVKIEHHADFGEMDETFAPVIHYYSDAYAEAVAKQFEEYGGADIASDIAPNVEQLCDIIDYEDSPGYKSGELTDLDMIDTKFSVVQGEEPIVEGSLKTACTISDALVLQYYEELDAKKAAFGKDMTKDMWQQTADITTKYTEVRHGLPLVAINTANPIIKEIKNEFTDNERKFTFLCGHDCTVHGVLVSMEAEDYQLPYTIEKKTPIGVKLVFEKWEDKDGNEFAAVELMYQSTEQLRAATMLDLDTPPVIYSLSFEGLEKNSDGLYAYEDIIGRIDKALDDYDNLEKEYGDTVKKAA